MTSFSAFLCLCATIVALGFEDEILMQIHTNESMYSDKSKDLVETDGQELAGIFEQTAGCAAESSASVKAIAQTCYKMSQEVANSVVLSPVHKIAGFVAKWLSLVVANSDGQFQSLGLAEATAPQCDAPPSTTNMFLLVDGVTEQVSKMHELFQPNIAWAERFERVTDKLPVCAKVKDMARGYVSTVRAVDNKLYAAVGDDLLEFKHQLSEMTLLQLSKQNTSLLQMMQRANEICTTERDALRSYASDMASYCRSIKDCGPISDAVLNLQHVAGVCEEQMSKIASGDLPLLCNE